MIVATRLIYAAAFLTLVLACVSCKDGAPKGAATTTSSESTQQVFHVKGIVQEVLPEKKKVRIEHEEIPNYMERMVMDFDVKTTNELNGLIPGDQVTFKMVVTKTDGWIEDVKKTGRSAPLAASPDSMLRIRDLQPLEIGSQVPDYTFTNQAGKIVKFSDFRGQALAFTFIFTRCPFPTFCPRMSTFFKDAQVQLQAGGTPTNWHLMTISFDPEFDTPEVMQSYAKGFEANPERWSFTTSSLSNIVELSDQIGLVFYKGEPNNPAALNHNLRTVVLDTDGRIRKIFRDNEWKPEELVAEIKAAANPNASAPAATNAPPASTGG